MTGSFHPEKGAITAWVKFGNSEGADDQASTVAEPGALFSEATPVRIPSGIDAKHPDNRRQSGCGLGSFERWLTREHRD